MWQRLQEIPGYIFPITWGSLSNADKIDALAAASQALAAFLSLTALLVSLWVFYRQQKLNRWQLRLHREDHIIEWSRSCIGVLAEIEEAARTHSGTSTELLPQKEFIILRSRLSAMIDEGRLYFPNIQSRTYGRKKHEAYRGHRQPILDPLVEFYGRMKDIQSRPEELGDEKTLDALNAVRRKFVSAAQTAIDPRRFNRIRA